MAIMRVKILALAVAISALSLSACVQEDYLPTNSRHYVPLPPSTVKLMSEKAMTKEAPILIRTYKQESEFEVWKRGSDGKYALLKIFPMCRWSGQLGPKVREGDRQVPEGFYTLTPGQLNPNSSYYVAINVGYPNAYDKAYGRTGGLIMMHGACSSAGCLSMTDEQIAEIYALTREAFAGGQQQVQVQSMPFRMTPKNFAKFRADPHIAFWKNLKEGADHFEITKQEPKVAVCGKKYVFDATSKGGVFNPAQTCPSLEVEPTLASAVAEKTREDEVKVAQLAASGERAMHRIYVDGDQHPSFQSTASANGTVLTRAGRHVEVSQIGALQGVREEPVEDKTAKTVPVKTIIVTKAPFGKNKTEKPAEPVIAIAPAPVAPASQSTVPQSTMYKRWFGAGQSEEAMAQAPSEPLVAQPLLSTQPLKIQPLATLPARK